MATRLEKSGGLRITYGFTDELDAQNEWSRKRSKLGAFLVAVATVTAALFIFPHMPGAAMLSKAFKSILAAIW